jgi:quercetin dioxygenase-like cupin family protein
MTSLNRVTSADVTPLQVIGEQVRVLLPAERSGGVEVFLQEGTEGIGPPPHQHAWDESYFVLEGVIEVSVGDAVHRLAAGDLLHVPGGTVHSYRNASPRTRILSVTNRPGAAAFFAAMDREVAFPPDLATAVAVAGRNGVRVASPPAP